MVLILCSQTAALPLFRQKQACRLFPPPGFHFFFKPPLTIFIFPANLPLPHLKSQHSPHCLGSLFGQNTDLPFPSAGSLSTSPSQKPAAAPTKTTAAAHSHLHLPDCSSPSPKPSPQRRLLLLRSLQQQRPQTSQDRSSLLTGRSQIHPSSTT